MTSKWSTRKPLKFFLLVFGLSIPFWVVEIVIDVKRSALDFSIIDILTAFTPLVASSILVYIEEGRSGITKLLARILDFSRIKRKIWYLPIILLPLFIYSLIFLIIHFIGLPLPEHLHIPFKSLPFLLVLFFIGAICEEVGYMGYAIEPMQKRFGALWAGICMGILWAVWHYPSIIQQGHNFYWVVWATLGTIAVRVLIVWIYGNTGKSLFACILFHTMLNVGRPLFPKDKIHNPLVDYPEIHYSLIAAVAIIIVVVCRTKTIAHNNDHTKHPSYVTGSNNGK